MDSHSCTVWNVSFGAGVAFTSRIGGSFYIATAQPPPAGTLVRSVPVSERCQGEGCEKLSRLLDREKYACPKFLFQY